VIDIEGDPLPSLSWYTGEVQPGLEIYAAGYPLGDPEFTLTRGIVSKAE
jgi:serine protease Do